MIKLTIDGKLLSVGRSQFPSKCTVLIGIPGAQHSSDDDEAPEFVPLEFEVTDDQAKMFAPHILDRVRVDFTVIPTLKIVDAESAKKPKRKKKKTAKSKVRRTGKADRVQDDDKEG